MTGQDLLILAGIAASSAAISHAISRWSTGPARWILFILAAFLPLIAYTIFGISEGCVLAEQVDAEACFGWGFGLAMLIPFGMPLWLFGFCLGGYLTRPAQPRK